MGKKIITQNVSKNEDKNFSKNHFFQDYQIFKFLGLRLYLWSLLQHFHSLLLLCCASKVFFLKLCSVHKAQFFMGAFEKTPFKGTKKCSWGPNFRHSFKHGWRHYHQKIQFKICFWAFPCYLKLGPQPSLAPCILINQ